MKKNDNKRNQDSSGWGSYLLFLFSIMFLAFLAGSIITVAEVSPSGFIRDAYKAGSALLEKLKEQGDQYSSNLWSPAVTSNKGVTIYDRQKSYQGLTLFTSGDNPSAYLMDMDGRIIHQWECRFSSIWDKTAAVKSPVPDKQTYFDNAHVFPNGDLLAIIIGVGDSPYGYGMVKLDRDSKVLWKNLDHFHHDFDIAADGKIYGLTHVYRFKPLDYVDHLKKPFLDDFLVIMTPGGKITKKISISDAVNKTEYRRLLWYVPYYTLEDPLHTNNVDLLNKQMAEHLRAKIPVAAEGQVLLSFREFAGGSLALLDVEKEEIVWLSRGPWLSQHDPDILPNGNLMVFDNRGYFGPGGQSRVIEVDPTTLGIVWQYAGNQDQKLDSWIRSSQQLLPNGNLLITDSNNGRLVEVNRAGEIVWEYISTVRGGPDNKLIPVVSTGQRIKTTEFNPEFYAELSGNTTAGEVHTHD